MSTGLPEGVQEDLAITAWSQHYYYLLGEYPRLAYYQPYVCADGQRRPRRRYRKRDWVRTLAKKKGVSMNEIGRRLDYLESVSPFASDGRIIRNGRKTKYSGYNTRVDLGPLPRLWRAVHPIALLRAHLRLSGNAFLRGLGYGKGQEGWFIYQVEVAIPRHYPPWEYVCRICEKYKIPPENIVHDCVMWYRLRREHIEEGNVNAMGEYLETIYGTNFGVDLDPGTTKGQE